MILSSSTLFGKVLCKLYSFAFFNSKRSLKCMSSIARSSFVQDIRQQQILKRKIDTLHYKNGKYLITDYNRKLAVVDQNWPETCKLAWYNYHEVIDSGVDIELESVFLSYINGTCQFAIDISLLRKENLLSFKSKFKGKFTSMREILFNISYQESSLLAQSFSILEFKHTSKFCTHCGGPLQNTANNSNKKCGVCGYIYYPFIKPVGIVLISNSSHDKVLLVRQRIHPKRMFTCVAGFIEPGESVEDNIRREVAEEVGLEVQNIQYAGSQSWSLPSSSLMIGCFATVETENFIIDTEELEEARWFTPDDLKVAVNAVKDKKLKILFEYLDVWVPPPGAIAHTLIETWLKTHNFS